MFNSRKVDHPAKTFNNNMTKLFERLAKEYPNYKPIKTYGSKFDDTKRMNFKMCAEIFVNVFGEYAKQINERDEEHFFNHIDHSKIVESPTYLKLIQEIMELWKESTNEKFKSELWASFKVLLYYAAKANDRDDVIQILKNKSSA